MDVTGAAANRPRIGSVAVFCGAQPGHDPACLAAAAALGRGLAQAGLRLVYGAGSTGMMGAVADGALAAGGKVMGVVPDFLTRLEHSHRRLHECVITDSMHSRKRLMFDQADAFVTLPGGLGTFDETIEIITWRQLGLHAKPILICDIGGSSLPFVALVDAAIAQGYARAEVRELFTVTEGVEATLARLATLTLPAEAASSLL
ncbi:MAG: TIGR00730 family Rossman fold protein [Acetobacteraceae bacterium]